MRLGVDPVPRRVTVQDLSSALYEISVRSEDSVLISLSQTPLWKDLEVATRDQNWWYRRTVQLVKSELVLRPGDWHSVYASLSQCGLEFDRCQNYKNKLLIEVLLEIGANPSQGLAIVYAVQAGNLEVVKLLLKDNRLNLNATASIAAGRGYVSILEALLNDPRSDKTDTDIWEYTVTTEREDVARFLLEDRRVDPSLRQNATIITASERGLTEIVRMLLEDPRVDPTDQDLEAVKSAVKNGFSDVLRLLLQDKRVLDALPNTPTLDGELYEAAMRSKIEVLRAIFDNGYKSGNIEWILQWAVKVAENLEVITLLLDQVVIDVLDDNMMEDLVRYAQSRKRADVEALLIEYWKMLKASR